jgi:integrase/recombinase XerD
MIETDLKQFKSYLEAKGRSYQTIGNYISGVKLFLQYVDKDPKDITVRDVEGYCRHARRHYHSNTLTPRYCSVKAFLRFLKLDDLLEQCIEEELLKPPKWKIQPKAILSKDEIQSMFKASNGNLRDNAILKTLYYSTQRCGSIQALRIQDINFSKEEIHIFAKGDREYSVDLHPEALQSIKAYLEVRPRPKHKEYEDVLFLNEWGEPLTRVRIWQLVKLYAIKCGIKKRVYPHLFRATSITHMDDSGMSLAQIKLQSGHENLKSLDTYLQPDKRKVKAKVRTALNLDDTNRPDTPNIKPKMDTQSKVTDDTDDTTNYIASLEEKIQTLQAKLRDRDTIMYG